MHLDESIWPVWRISNSSGDNFQNTTFIARPVRAAGSLDTLSDAEHGKVMDVHADAANSRYRFYFIEGFDWPNRCRRTIKGTSILST